jgi:hypothetical protein
MRRAELEHLIRAAATIADDDELIVIGSQAVLGQFPDAPAVLCVSTEADIYPKNHPERWDLIDGSIGELSPFHETYGYYAQGVEEGTAIVPAGYRQRLVPICNANTRGATGLCLEVHDLLISKYVANREKDRRFIQAAIAHALADQGVLLERLADTEIGAEARERIRRQILHDFALGSA